MHLRSWKLTAGMAVGVLVTSFTVPTIGVAFPRINSVSKVQQLAERIDKLQKHIDAYGTVISKAPDVWGQSRLLEHREDVERQLKDQLDKFEFRLNATEITRDSAFLASALAIQGATNPNATPQTVTANTDNVVQTLISNPIPAQGANSTADIVTRTNTTSGFNQQFVSPVKTVAPNVTQSLSVEPEIFVDQMKRYLDHLNALRRINEGDDTADGPGYSLNLVRFPISVIPGKKTQMGHGAEITVTIKPYLSHELLPQAFRDLVVNGVTDRITPKVLGIADRGPIPVIRAGLQAYYSQLSTLNDDLQARQVMASTLNEFKSFLKDEKARDIASTLGRPDVQTFAQLKTLAQDFTPFAATVPQAGVESDDPGSTVNPAPPMGGTSWHLMIMNAIRQDPRYQQMNNGAAPTPAPAPPSAGSSSRKTGPGDSIRQAAFLNNARLASHRNRQVGGGQSTELDQFFEAYSNQQDIQAKALDTLVVRFEDHVDSSGIIQPRGKLSVARTCQRAVDGYTLFRVALDVFDHQSQSKPLLAITEYDSMPPGERGLIYLNVKSFLKSECQAAYDYLSQPDALPLWEYCTPELARAIRGLRRTVPEPNSVRLDILAEQRNHLQPTQELTQIRGRFFRDITQLFPESRDSTTANLAWHVIVEAALLNERLLEDMKQIAADKNCTCMPTDWMPFYGPNPPLEAREAFKQYVDCRWPIHVFALDPQNQEQNVGQAFSRRRELQLVLAVAAANRKIGFQSLTRFVRRLEYDLETVELNRTEVGFSHGSDTFGWRFYPRVQAPAVRGNLAVAGELLLGGPSRQQDKLTRQLEPGIRECQAIVVMPSFVPYVTVDFKSSWFTLANNWIHRAGHRRLEVKDAVDQSREIVELRTLSQACVKDAHKYRDGEVHRLQRVVDQLDRQLPLQTSFVQVPYENTLSGFEMFNTGVTDLSPELHGWYGAAGVVLGGPSPNSASRAADITATHEQTLVAIRAYQDARRAYGPGADETKPPLKPFKDEMDKAIANSKEARAAAIEAGLIPVGTTSLFLIGKNFSVFNIKVIAGGVAIPEADVKLISRQMIQVTIPWTARTVDINGQRYVPVHLATPYGATSQLHVPVASDTRMADALARTQADIITKATTQATANATAAAKAEAGKIAVAEAKKQVDAGLAPLAQLTAMKFIWADGDKQAANSIQSDALTMKVKLATEVPNVPGFQLTNLESAWFVEIVDSQGNAAFFPPMGKRLSFGPYRHVMRDGVIDLKRDVTTGRNILDDIGDKLGGTIQGAKAIRLHGFLRFADLPRKSKTLGERDALPISKLDPLEIKFIVPGAAPADAPADAPAPEAAPEPAPAPGDVPEAAPAPAPIPEAPTPKL